ARFSCSFGPENRASACAGECLAEMCAYPSRAFLSGMKRTVNVIERLRTVSMERQVMLQSPSFDGKLSGENARPAHAHLVSPQSFPHLWKKLWKNAAKPRGTPV